MMMMKLILKMSLKVNDYDDDDKSNVEDDVESQR